jgi:hypothetical protein
MPNPTDRLRFIIPIAALPVVCDDAAGYWPHRCRERGGRCFFIVADDISVKSFEVEKTANLSFAQACWEETQLH